MNILVGKLAAETIGTMFLLLGIVGTGIAALGFSEGSPALTLLMVSLSAAAMLYVWISVFGSISGAHFNPAVTLAFCLRGECSWASGTAFMSCQVAGAAIGTGLANVMFGLPFPQWSSTGRTGIEAWGSEVLATFGLVLLILCLVRRDPARIALAVAAYIFAAHWCTFSTSFANPAVALARTMTDTFTGISPDSIPAFVASQLVGSGLAVAASLLLFEPQD